MTCRLHAVHGEVSSRRSRGQVQLRPRSSIKAEILCDKSKTTAVEAGATGLWYKYADKVLGVDTFGESAPAPLIFEKKGITAANLAKVASA